jgi:YidC/Oxa1 family membrane protein insertase
MTTLAPKQGASFQTAAKYSAERDTYQTEFRYPVVDIQPASSYSVETNLFAGAKEWAAINSYEKSHNIEKFVDSIDQMVSNHHEIPRDEYFFFPGALSGHW